MRSHKEQWIKDLPYSRMIYPTARRDKAKYWFWKVYTPFHPLVRDFSYFLGIGKMIARRFVPEMAETGRQNFLIGSLIPERSAEELAGYLVSQGFGNHFVAWRDTDEIVSLRRMVDFKNQYHLRIFEDREIRGHYEYTPECHAIRHLIRIGFEDRTEEFQELLKDWVILKTKGTE